MSERSTNVSAFYAREADRLLAAVRKRTRAGTEQVVEDACQHAWLALVRRQDISLDARGARWLITVATHEAWRLARPRDTPVGSFRGQDVDNGELPEPESLESDVQERALELAEYAERVAHLSTLRPLERRDLLLKAAGFSYDEIAAMTESTASQVNHHLARGRRRLRRNGE